MQITVNRVKSACDMAQGLDRPRMVERAYLDLSPVRAYGRDVTKLRKFTFLAAVFFATGLLVSAAEPAAADIYGTPGNDHIRGTVRGNWIEGLEGNDVIRGLGGDDFLFGQEGVDWLMAVPGQTSSRALVVGTGCSVGNGADWLLGCAHRSSM